MDAKLTEAFWHVPHRCLGRRLRPLTLRHCFVLATAGNPLICGGTVTQADILQAVEICSRDANFFLHGRKPNWIARQITGVASMLDKLAILRITAYFNDYASAPGVWATEGGDRAKSHWTISAVAGLCHWLGMDYEKAWNMTPGEASHMLAAAIEQSPHAKIDLVSEEEAAMIERIKAEEEVADA